MKKVFITNFHKIDELFIGDIRCDECNLLIVDYIFEEEDMKKFMYALDNVEPGKEFYMNLSDDDILILKDLK
jgi:hypothetical protein